MAVVLSFEGGGVVSKCRNEKNANGKSSLFYDFHLLLSHGHIL